MSEPEALDFSGLFKLETLVQMEVEASCYCEVGQRKMIAVGGAKGLEFHEITKVGDTIQKTSEWASKGNPIRSMCFEPTATWLLIVSDCNLSLVPFLPYIEPEADYDHRWSLTEPTVIPFASEGTATVAWWHTMESENIAIIALKCGKILFYSLDLMMITAETKVPDKLVHIQISADDSLDVLALLITGTDRHQWKLVLEHRSVKYNWLRDGAKPSIERDKKDGFMGYIKEKITNLSQNSSTEKVNVVEYSRAPTTYLPAYRKHTSDWSITVQYVKGGHFVNAFDVKSGSIVLESTEEDTHSRTMQARLKKDENYRQALWSDKVLYLLTDNAVEVHSSSFAAQLVSSNEDSEETCLWRAELPGVLHRAFLMSPHAGHRRQPSGWEPPTFLCDLQLPRFQLEGCLVLGSKGAFVLGTMLDPCEWLVGLIVRGGRGADRSAAALAAPVDTLMRSSADMLLSRSKLEPAKYLYDLSKGSQDGWVIRLGMFGFLEQVANYKSSSNDGSTVLSFAPALVRVLAQLMYLVVNPVVTKGALDILAPGPTTKDLIEPCYVAASLGLWDALSVFSLHRGLPELALKAIGAREFVCVGALQYILKQKYLTMYLLDFNVEFLHTHLILNDRTLHTKMLKRFCMFMSPLHEQLRPVMRNLKDGVHNVYTNRLETLIACFMRLVCEIDAREPTPHVPFAPKQEPEVFKERFAPRRTVSCGLMHWAMSDKGDAVVMNVTTPIKTDLIGRVVTVACGRHHTIILTENGIYTAGDNSHGQLGVGSAWEGGAGETAAAGGQLMLVQASWDVRVVSVAAGHYHSVAVDSGGRLYTWGWGVHGQLGLGDTYDALTPQLVTRLQGRKVLQVGCGACHTTVLLRNGEVWAFGASMFGQLGSGNREKSSLPVRVVLLPPDDPVRIIAVGYFHTLTVTSKGELWTWGASPQCVRAANNMRRAATSPRPDDDSAANIHLAPTSVDIGNVRGTILQISAGWHHSCLLTHLGFIYTWGLNFDGQLGSGDRKQVAIPTQIEIPPETTVDDASTKGQGNVASPEDALAPRPEWTAKPLVACGGDFTVCVNDYGKIYIAGNTHTQNDTKLKGNRVIMMKTTRRIIKIPTSKLNNKFRFQFIDKIDNILLGSDDQRHMIPMTKNPVANLFDFERPTWVDEIIYFLRPWITEKYMARNPNVAAKLAYHNKKYALCLELQLKTLKTPKRVQEPMKANLHSSRENEHKTDKAGYIIAKIKGRIKEIGKAFMNERSIPEVTENLYKSLPCYCVEATEDSQPIKASDFSESRENLALNAARIIDDCLKTFPVCYEAWDEYLRCAKKYFTDNDLPGDELEGILNKYLDEHSSLVGSAVLLSDNCSERLFTPTFLLRLCQGLFEVQC